MNNGKDNLKDNLAMKIISCRKRTLTKEITHPDCLPDKGEVVEIIDLLRNLLFPGYFEEQCLAPANTERGVASLLEEVEFKLKRQICRALDLDSGAGACAKKAEEICDAFLGKLPDLLEVLLSDVQATYDGDPAAHSKHEIIFAYPGIFAITVYRLAHELYLLSVPFIPRIMTEYAHGLTGIDIHPGANISHHFFIDHGTGIVIGETTTIGAHAKLYQGVTLGALSTRGGQSLRGKKRHPTLEDEVTVYSGASILGGETVIGKGSVIGGNAFITQSVPENTRVNIKSHELIYKTLKTQQQ
jgi:serine O-acetyltransferase